MPLASAYRCCCLTAAGCLLQAQRLGGLAMQHPCACASCLPARWQAGRQFSGRPCTFHSTAVVTEMQGQNRWYQDTDVDVETGRRLLDSGPGFCATQGTSCGIASPCWIRPLLRWLLAPPPSSMPLGASTLCQMCARMAGQLLLCPRQGSHGISAQAPVARLPDPRRPHPQQHCPLVLDQLCLPKRNSCSLACVPAAAHDGGLISWCCKLIFCWFLRMQAVEKLGGLRAIAISHPHFYSSMLDWSERFSVPIFIHEVGRFTQFRPFELRPPWLAALRLAASSSVMLLVPGPGAWIQRPRAAVATLRLV